MTCIFHSFAVKISTFTNLEVEQKKVIMSKVIMSLRINFDYYVILI